MIASMLRTRSAGTVLAAGVALLIAKAGLAATPPSINYLPAASSLVVIGLDVSDDGATAMGFVSGDIGFIYRRDGIPQIFTVTGGQGTGGLSGMSADGSIFAGEFNSGPLPEYSPGWTQAALYTIPSLLGTGSYTPIPRPPEAIRCDRNGVSVDDISHDGQAIAVAVWAACRTSPAIWRADSGYTFLPELPGLESQSHKIWQLNRDGTAAAGWYQNGTGPGGRGGLVWSNGTLIRLDQPGQTIVGEAYAISPSGQWVAGTLGSPRLYRWSSSRGVEDLGAVFTAANPTQNNRRNPVAAAITDDGNRIVGQHSFGIDRDAFIWTPQSGGIKLTTWLISRGLDLDAQFVRLTSCAGMSSNGRYLTGQYANDLTGEIGPFIIDLGPDHLACSAADIANTDGEPGSDPDGSVDNGDFTVFFAAFFAEPGDPIALEADIADTDGELGIPWGSGIGGPDGQVDNGDFTAFFAVFFNGCPN
jgi:hypothetical protein